MLLTMQSFVRQRFSPLIMVMAAAGFLLLLLEMIGYNHFGGVQLIGTGAVIIGLIASLFGINARGGVRKGLIYLFLVLALTGLLGEWEHNEDRLGGEGERGSRTEQGTGGAQSGEGQGDGDQQSGPRGEREEIPPPILAPLSVSGLCLLGAVTLLARRDRDDEEDVGVRRAVR